MKQHKLTLSILAIITPWLVLLMKDDPIMALVALVLQASFIGWPLATIWAWRNIRHQPISQTSSTEVAHK